MLGKLSRWCVCFQRRQRHSHGSVGLQSAPDGGVALREVEAEAVVQGVVLSTTVDLPGAATASASAAAALKTVQPQLISLDSGRALQVSDGVAVLSGGAAAVHVEVWEAAADALLLRPRGLAAAADGGVAAAAPAPVGRRRR